jgi:hypothetical protein
MNTLNKFLDKLLYFFEVRIHKIKRWKRVCLKLSLLLFIILAMVYYLITVHIIAGIVLLAFLFIIVLCIQYILIGLFKGVLLLFEWVLK